MILSTQGRELPPHSTVFPFKVVHSVKPAPKIKPTLRAKILAKHVMRVTEASNE